MRSESTVSGIAWGPFTIHHNILKHAGFFQWIALNLIILQR